jgi:hypothetical protein
MEWDFSLSIKYVLHADQEIIINTNLMLNYKIYRNMF